MRPTGFLRNPEDVFGEVLLRVLRVGQLLLEQLGPLRLESVGDVLKLVFLIDTGHRPQGDLNSLVPIRIQFHSVPATTNLLGAKGCGEAGCAGSLPSVMNAVVDALSARGINHIDMPATPQRVWEALRAAG